MNRPGTISNLTRKRRYVSRNALVSEIFHNKYSKYLYTSKRIHVSPIPKYYHSQGASSRTFFKIIGKFFPLLENTVFTNSKSFWKNGCLILRISIVRELDKWRFFRMGKMRRFEPLCHVKTTDWSLCYIWYCTIIFYFNSTTLRTIFTSPETKVRMK